MIGRNPSKNAEIGGRIRGKLRFTACAAAGQALIPSVVPSAYGIANAMAATNAACIAFDQQAPRAAVQEGLQQPRIAPYPHRL
jgi:hypothetical protein